METTYSYNNLTFQFPVFRAFSLCAQQIEERVPSVESLHFNVRRSSRSSSNYRIELRAISDKSAVYTKVDTKNVIKGLKILKNRAISRLREEHRKSMELSRRLNKEEQLDFYMENYYYKEAK